MKIENLTGLSKPLEKLIEVVSNGIGAISKPYLIRKTADAKAYEIKAIAEAVKEHQETLKSIDYNDTKVSLISIDKESLIENNYPINERAQERLSFQENKRQQNIESITQSAFNNLENEPDVSDEKVDDDWTTRFFNYAQDISNEEMQNLWGRILSGEVKRPNSFSLRTLDIVRNLTKQDAEVFMKIANYAIYDNRETFLYNQNDTLEKLGLSFNDIALMQEIGLLYSGQFLTYTFFKAKGNERTVFDFGENLVFFDRKENTPDQNISIISFTKTGKELLSLVERKPKFEYIQYFAKAFKHSLVELKFAPIIERINTSIKHSKQLFDIDEI